MFRCGTTVLLALFVTSILSCNDPSATKFTFEGEATPEFKATLEGLVNNPPGTDKWEGAMRIAEIADARAIPILIGVIDADNSYDTVYGIGYFALSFGKLGERTGVRYRFHHDGAWWRRWWAQNKARFPEAQDIPIPDFPKNENGKTYVPFSESLDTFEGKLTYIRELLEAGKLDNIMFISTVFAEEGDPRAIPTLIGVIDADNSYATVYGVGYSALGFDAMRRITGVQYQFYHDGAWWRRWWAQNKSRFPEAQDIPIPDFPKTEHGKKHVPFPDDLDTFDGKISYLLEQFAAGQLRSVNKIAQALAEEGDPRAIPTLIGIIDADNSYDTVYGVGYYGLGFGNLGKVTGVEYSAYHDGAWWRRWWEQNKSQFPQEVQAIAIPNLEKTEHGKKYTPFPEDKSPISPLPAQREQLSEAEKDALEAELADAPSQEIIIGEDANKRYFLIGPKAGAQAPDLGFKLAVIMPGGDGGPDFNPFVRRILKHALGPDWIVAQPIAIKWKPSQQIVWPTEIFFVEDQQFSTEAFVESVIADVKNHLPIDSRNIVTMSWSSSGPAAYAIALQPQTAVTGSYISMSVFKPDDLPPLANAKDRRFYIEHSPDDRVCRYTDAEKARKTLREAGATVESCDYEGGHGWRGKAFTRIENAMKWLTSPSLQRAAEN